MSPRYLLVVGDDTPSRSDLLRRVTGVHHLLPALSNARIAALANPACPCIAVADAGCILGWLFPRHGPAALLETLDPAAEAAAASSQGQTLLSTCWGGYVAALSDAARTRVLRDPSGTFSCYHADLGELQLFASDAALLVTCGVRIDLDVEEIGRELDRAFVPSRATALAGIRELLPGFALRLEASGWSEEACWSPWDHVVLRDGTIAGAADRLRRHVSHCAASWAAAGGRLLLSVSGGLDSSILAACLANAGADTTCLTMFTDDPGGDEREHAQALCDHLGLPLIARAYRLEDVDLDQPLAPHLPRPRDRTQANAYERVHLEVASEIGADAFVTGNGGDHVLAYSQSAAPVADRYLAEGLGEGVLRSLLDVCAQTGCSLFAAIGQAFGLARRPPAYQVRRNSLFLDPRFLAGLSAADRHHPWLDAPAGALPGKAAHIAAILRVQPNLEASRGYYLPVLSPMLSQPIVEACLAIPSWQWRAGGRDRSVARLAFAPDLPPSIVNRRVKGSPGRFAALLFDHFRGGIRERLLDGRLAASGIVDRKALERALGTSGPVPDLERIRILELVNIEAWMAHWAGR